MRSPATKLAIGLLLSVLTKYTHATCKAIPGDPGWPSVQEWATFNASLDGVLLKPPPPGGVCHPGEPNYDPALCPNVTALWTTSFPFHEDDPISNAFNNWNNDSCLPYPQAPCSGEGYPIYVVNATKPEHVQKAINFARERNIRLNVKCSGHDYLGRSVAPNSLSIWVHNMHGIELHDSFVPQRGGKNRSCIPEGLDPFTSAITFAAGDTNGDVYAAANTIGMAVPVTGGHDVCYGGYVTGAGHSILGARHGLAADLVLELTVVTPDGNIVIANSCQNRDLFWALRGGGGATFGVIVSFTLALYPDEPTDLVVTGIGPIVNNSVHFYDAAAYAFTQYPAIVDQGWAGYGFLQPSNSTVPGVGSQFYVDWFGLGRNATQLIELATPIANYINATWPNEFGVEASVFNFPSFYDFWAANTDTGSPVGVDIVIGSRLLDKTAIDNPNLASYLQRAVIPGGQLTEYMVGGPGVHNKPPSLNAVCPAWRTAYSHSVVGVGWVPFQTAMETQQLSDLNVYVEALTELAPDMGAYVNEADPFQENYHEVFWGANYPRLLAIKKGVDPCDVFWCRACVGNEGWQEVGDQLCRV
ncbi:FAD-binding domain containing protein [Hyaloscypha variabilis]